MYSPCHTPECDGLPLPPSGQVTIPGEITFWLDTDPATDPPVFTLTCTSTGGPATTVSWRRDGTMLSDDSTYSITSQVTDTETATYTHTLTVTGRLEGEYQCSVSNTRALSSRSLAIAGKECNNSQRKHTVCSYMSISIMLFLTHSCWLTHQPQRHADQSYKFHSLLDPTSHCDWVPGVLEWRWRG